MPIKFTNNASSTTAIAISASDTSIVLSTGSGTKFPSLASGEYFYATLVSLSGVQEIVRVTARSGDTVTVVRAQESTSAANFSIGSRFELRVTAQSVLDILGNADASGINFTPAGTGAVTRTVESKLRETVSVKDFGAKGDGVTNDTASILAAFTYASTLANPIVYIPAGTYSVASNTDLFRVTSNMTVTGDGMDATIIKWSATYPGTTIAMIAGRADLVAVDSVTLKDFAIRGDHDTTGYDEASCFPILIRSCTNLKIDSVKITYSRIMAIAVRQGIGVDISNCVIQYCARDGINTADSNYVKITNNRIEFCDDDAIAGHTRAENLNDRAYVVSGNIISFAQGIKLLGAKTATITGNTLEFVFGQGIDIQTYTGTGGLVEGVNSASGVVISGNTIKNCIDRSIIDGLSTTSPYIVVNGASAQAGSLAAIPGENATATGTIVPLYPYFENSNSSNVTLPIPSNYSLIIGNNICVRDVQAGVAVSTFGVGQFYTRTGPKNPTLTEASLRQQGVFVNNGTYKNVSINNNIFMGIQSGLFIGSTAKLVNAIYNDNVIFDCYYGVAASGTNTLHQNLYIIDNVFDLDPLHTSSNRGANGTWLALGNPTAITIQNSHGYAFGGNRFKNCGRVSDYSVTDINVVQATKLRAMHSNYLECDPAATGFSTSNKGIGFVPSGSNFILSVVDSDPASATFGQVLNYCPTQANNIPTAGKYIAGHRVVASVPVVAGTAGSQYTVTGWWRINTGTTHVINTDWVEMRTLTGT